MTSTTDKYSELLEIYDDEDAISRFQPEDFQKEVVVDQKTGVARQAGTTAPAEFINRLKKRCESDLHVFSKAIMGRDYLTKALHLPICNFLQKTPPFRKLLLLPRDHAKTSIVAHCLPPHIIIQSAESNIYFPGWNGSEMRILLAGETEGMASRNLRVVQAVWESNQLFRTLWPHVCWTKPKSEAKKWNNLEMIVPRETEWPDPTVRAIGVGGAITGARPTVLIKDDLVSIEAANSETVMQTAIDWHIASRALMEEYEKDTGMEALEFIIGTRWAVWDLYEYVIQNDPTVETVIRAIIEDEKPIWPERFDQPRIAQLQREFGSMFWLLYMNSAANPELSDFDVSKVRYFEFQGNELLFTETEDDALLEEKWTRNPLGDGVKTPSGAPLNKHTWKHILGRGRGEFFRLRYG
jgi:hypothetical protein